MRRIAVLVAIVTLLGGLPVAALATGEPSRRPCAQPRLLILSAFPAEMGKIMKATALDSVEPDRSPAPGSKEFWTGTIESKPVILGLTGIGPVTPIGTGVRPFWDALSAGHGGIGPIRRWDPEGLQVRIGGELLDIADLHLDVPEHAPQGHDDMGRLDRPGDDVREERLEDEVVLAIDERYRYATRSLHAVICRTAI